MRSPDDRTARARIRDEALRLLAEAGPDGVSIRDVARAAEVSPALVLKHYGSKEGLLDAVDAHAVTTFEGMLREVTGPAATPTARAEPTGLAVAVAQHVPADSAVPAYLGRMLLGSGEAGTALFARLYEVARAALASMVTAGTADPGPDPETRAAFLLANDLAVLVLRPHLARALGYDPLSAPGMARWGREVLTVYTAGLGGTGPQGGRT
ncbi:TetR/AcrR family transcriptional regulator [Actinotalea sp. M2MS4P-6]|uniref:TetR/AcrR family transcriptional regulator n=1 Tax=Actinotalea sp. M2MS4P-6 TaxID=2983762 RepID=UPI0021E42F1A|nr:TetR/AcrR family transcriptional regulator [Actinotalea sp. M2MS4P-6]MCV2393635.1 TetR/AcrR family transcriptional regulator [Actinotalea sp. M2MS4P-6]